MPLGFACTNTADLRWQWLGRTTKGFYENKIKKKTLRTNKPFGISSEPAISSEEMNLKDVES